MATALLVGCAGDIDLRGRPCAGEVCLPGFTCDAANDRCVGTGDNCDTEAALLPCVSGDSVCAEGCRVCRDGAWSDCVVPDLPLAPTLEGIVDLCAGEPATVTWATAANVTYEVEFWDTAAWVTPTAVANGTATQSAPDAGVDYQWRIRATNNVGQSDWRTSVLFAVTAIPENPLLDPVSDLCTGVPALLSWTAEAGESYTVEFFDGLSWIPPDSVLVDNASTTPPAAGTYKWRIATNIGRCTADWTESAELEVAPPPSIYEVRVSTTADPRISGSWKRTDGCSAEIRLQRDQAVIPLASDDGTPVTTSSLGFNDTSVVPGPLYYYRPFVDPLGLPLAAGPVLCATVGTTAIHPVTITEALTLDGSDVDTAWALSAGRPFDYSQRFSESAGNDPRVRGYMRFARDDDNFYFFISVEDRYIHVDASGDGVEANDGVELFFDMGFDRADAPDTNDYHFILVPGDSRRYAAVGNGTDWDDTYDSSTLSFASNIDGSLNDESDDDTSWSLEGRLPFALIGGAPSPAQTIGFAVWINEDDTEDQSAQHAYDWTGGSIWTDPRTWGVGQFQF